MRVHIKLTGLLKAKTPEGGVLDLGEGATIGEALDQLQIPLQSVQIFTVNGRLVRDREYGLGEGDELTVLPPAGGG